MVIHSNILVWRIPMDRGAWKATVHGVAKSWTQLKRLSMHAHTHKPPSMAKKLINRHFIKKKKKRINSQNSLKGQRIGRWVQREGDPQKDFT